MIKESNVKGLEYVYHEGELLCVILRSEYDSESISFFTPNSLSQQLGYLPHKKGGKIDPHKHKIHKREILFTQETLFIKKGKVKVNLYGSSKELIGSETLNEGDFILLCGGGHGLDILEDSQMIEIKQGPYVEADDKERF